jgi:hypothetical protein
MADVRMSVVRGYFPSQLTYVRYQKMGTLTRTPLMGAEQPSTRQNIDVRIQPAAISLEGGITHYHHAS